MLPHCHMILIPTGDPHIALNIAIAVLIITCPCALGLAVPAIVTVASGRLFAKDVLLKNATALERLATIDTIVFDKTGTLTSGSFQLGQLENWTKSELGILRQLASASNHPLSQAIMNQLATRRLPDYALSDITEIASSGLTARYEGQIVKLGRPDWVSSQAKAASDDDKTHKIVFKIGRQPPKFLAFSETIRPDIKTVLHWLDRAGYNRILLTGDRRMAAEQIAGQLGFSRYHTEMSPVDKKQVIDDLQKAGRRVLMIGDGLNDTAAMATADIVVAPTNALDAARAAADVILLGDNLSTLPDLIITAQIARKRILQNFSTTAIYNLVAVPLAFAGFITPLIAAIAMSTSSIIVSLNALRMSRGAKLPTRKKADAL